MAETTTERAPCMDCSGTVKRMVTHSGTKEVHQVRCQCSFTDLPFRLVYQPEGSACTLAAIATIAEVSYEAVRRLIDPTVDFAAEGLDTGIGMQVLAELGWACQARYRTDPRRGYIERVPWPCAPWADRHLCTVRNLSNTGLHAVVLLGDGRVLDPWWGVIQGLHRYPSVNSIIAAHRVTTAPRDGSP